MMKRATRTIDIPKLRRNLKSRGRIADSMCCGNISGLAYLKLILLWLSCIALDLLVGFRFELLYPLWLLIRNCYDSFRFQGLVTSLHYSAFSAFFVCATITIDLICFILLPVQLVFFLASTYVWILLVWQTADKGVSSTQLFLWLALISFEYNWRYRGDSALQLLRSSTLGSGLNYLTGGLLSNWLGLRDSPGSLSLESHQRTERDCHVTARIPGSILGSFGVAMTAAFAHSTSLTSDLCRPFAAHCIGYPVVTLGFGLKTYFSLWRVRRRQREVSRANEVYGKLLTEALPSLYEGPKIYSFSGRMPISDAEQIEYESEIYHNSVQNLAICPSSSSSITVTQRKNSRVGAGWKQNGWKQQHQQQHQQQATRRAVVASNGTSFPRKEKSACVNNDDDDASSSVSLSVLGGRNMWRCILELFTSVLSYLSNGSSNRDRAQHHIYPSIDDRMSISSNDADSDDELLEGDDTSQPDDLSRLSSFQRANNGKKNKNSVSSSGTCGRAKTGRSRGRNMQTNSSEYAFAQPSLASGVLPIPSSPGTGSTLNNNSQSLANGGLQSESATVSNNSTVTAGLKNNGIIVDSTNSLNIEKKNENGAAEEMEALRNDLRSAQAQGNEMRCLLQQYANTEKQLKSDVAQLRQKLEQTDSKFANALKTREQDKSAIQLLEKRLLEAQTKKNELEKELNAERRSKVKEEHAAARALAAAQSSRSMECGDACKVKKAELERENRAMRRDLKAKEEMANHYEDQLRHLRQYKDNNDLQESQLVIKTLHEKNLHLEKSLSAENRLKQDLFRALNDTRIQMEELKQQLLAKDSDLRVKDAQLMSFRNHQPSDIAENSKSSPTSDSLASLSVGTSGLSCCSGTPNVLVSSMVNGAAIKTSMGNDQSMEIYSASMGNQNNPFMYHTTGTPIESINAYGCTINQSN